MTKDIEKKPFTERELRLLRGNIGYVAKKNRVSREYVSRIINGKLPARSYKAQSILRDATKLLNTLKEFAG